MGEPGLSLLSAGGGGGSSVSPSGIGPSDYGWKGWTFEPLMATTSASGGNGFLLTSAVKIQTAATLANAICSVSTAGTTMTAALNIACVWDSSGVLIARTGDQAGVWNSTGLKVMPLTPEAGKSLAVTAGQLITVGLISAGAGPASFRRSASVTDVFVNTGALATSPALRGGFRSTTTPPDPLASLTVQDGSFWMAVS